MIAEADWVIDLGPGGGNAGVGGGCTTRSRGGTGHGDQGSVAGGAGAVSATRWRSFAVHGNVPPKVEPRAVVAGGYGYGECA